IEEYARGDLPFGVTQIGRAYRNEISPRNAVVRSREFTQAELELFVDPAEDEPALESVADLEAPLYSAEMQQDESGEPKTMTIGEAVERDVVADPWIAYYLGVAREWYDRVGVDMDRFRFRQHLPGELAHYSSDCWDAEADVSAPGEDPEWIELAGFSYRSDYDLSKHAEHSGERFTVFREYDEPQTVERATVDPDMSYLGPEFGGRAADVAEALEALVERDRSAFDGEEVVVEIDGESIPVPTEKTGFSVDAVTESGRHITPHVVEPSFGVDRAVYTVLVHAYEEDTVDHEERTVLRLPPAVAPTSVGVFPLMDKDGLGERARDLAERLRVAGFSVAYDDSGGIGRRYRRQDEIGTPFGVTVDYESLEDDTVTLRDRDTTAQIRVPEDSLADELVAIRDGDRRFADLRDDYPPAE
ncbi:MAG: glycine--tRNA ligase, partial [Halanaeroarchaeum sp.]